MPQNPNRLEAKLSEDEVASDEEGEGPPLSQDPGATLPTIGTGKGQNRGRVVLHGAEGSGLGVMTAGTADIGGAQRDLIAKPLSPILIGVMIRMADLFVVAIGGTLAYAIWTPYLLPLPSSQYFGAIVTGVVASGALFQWCGAYAGDYLFSKRLRLDRVLTGWIATCCLLLVIAFAFKITGSYTRAWSGTWFMSVFLMLVGVRILVARWVRQQALSGRFALRTVIVGAGEHGQRLAAHLNRFGDVHTRIIGFVDDRRDRVPVDCHGYDLLGDSGHLISMIRQDKVDQVFIALPWNAEGRVRRLIDKLAMTPVPIRLAPDLVGFELTDRDFTQVARLPMLHVFDRPISGWDAVAKSIEDRVISGLLLLGLAPLFAIIAMAIKLDSRGPVFFRQNRQGFNNQMFEVWKFRSMYVEQSDADCEQQTVRGDKRITRVGDFLRKTSLDELPQLINVLLGDMSIVGPRPHALATKAAGRRFEEVVEHYAARHKVKPGITGWAQVNGWRGETDTIEKLEKRVEFDLYYIDNWSVWFDLMIIAKTVLLVFDDDNAF